MPAAAQPTPAPPLSAAAKAPAKSTTVAAKAAESAKAPAAGEAESELARIQRLLVKLGYEPGAANGETRAATSRAIRLFQHDVGLKVDGRATKELLAFMTKLAGNE